MIYNEKFTISFSSEIYAFNMEWLMMYMKCEIFYKFQVDIVDRGIRFFSVNVICEFLYYH